jgi:hypothetical protein
MDDNKDEVIITKLKIKLAGDTKELTVDQARKLYAALGELFAEPKVRIEKEYIYWPSPISYYKHNPNQQWIYCTTDNSAANASFLSLEVN